MVFCRRALRRALRCGNSRSSVFVDIVLIIILIIACSVVASHLNTSNIQTQVHASAENDIQNDVLPKPNMLKQIIVDNIVENDIQREKQQIAKISNDQSAVPQRKERKRMNMHSRKEIDGVKYPLLNSVGNFIPIRRIVHIDLKGGALKVDYFEKVFEVLKALGATGVLIEWEDMFPFEGRLRSAVNGDAYSMQQVHRILRGAQKYGLDVIPLIQTFGHLEWILKLEEFAHLREASAFPQVICVSNDEAWQLLRDMIDQVVSVHKKFGMQFFHMGADEVFQIGYANSTIELMRNYGSKERVMLWHIARVAEYIRKITNDDVSVLAWHDMLTEVSEEDLRLYNVPSLIEPVLWSYAEDLNQYLSPSTWFALKPFNKVWGASAYKGADGPMRYSSNPIHYIRNNEAWIMQFTANYRDFQFVQGLILTGWSRYDHMAVLCELFPVAVPALSMSLESVIDGRVHNAEYHYPNTSKLFKCNLPTDRGFVVGCQFPGAQVYELINEFANQHELVQRYIESDFDFNGWLSELSIRYLYSSPMYINKILQFVEYYLNPLQQLKQQLRTEMTKIFFNDTVEEFIETYMEEDIKFLKKHREMGLKLLERKHFAKRPFISKPSNTH